MADIDFFNAKDSGLSIGLVTPPPEVLLTPNIGVIGVGGAGGNAVNNMVESGLEGISFVVANTDAQALSKSKVLDRIQLGVSLTQGLGAGSNPEVGRAAVEESLDKVKESLKGLHLLFVTAGMGGGTGTGASPVIAKLAKEMGIITVGVVSTPFTFEGRPRMRTAVNGMNELKKHVDTLIVIPNQNLFRVISSTTSMIESFKIADDVLGQGVRSISDLIMKPGMMNLDFADLKTVLSAMGRAMMGTGQSSGENRAQEAVENAISNPLLDNSSIKGAKSVLINITGGLDLTLSEVDMATQYIRQELDDEDANIIFGSCVDEALNGSIRVSLVAAGIEDEGDELAPQKPAPIVQPIQKPEAIVINEEITIEEKPQSIKTTISETQLVLLDTQSESEDDYEPVPTISNLYPELAVEVDEQPVREPVLFDDTPVVAPAREVPIVPDVQEPLNLTEKSNEENVKVVRSIFDLIPTFREKQAKKPEVAEKKAEPMAQNNPFFNATGPDSDFKDPFENVDLPAFLRHR